MPYLQYTLSQLTQEISVSLSDPGNVYWGVPEIQRAINEALLLWGALSSYWRERAQFLYDNSRSPFQDLSVSCPTLRTRLVTVNTIVQQIQDALIEPANGISGLSMTGQFSIASILQSVNRARNQFILDAKLPLTYQELNFSSPPVGRSTLPSQISFVSHLWWRNSQNVTSALRREDSFSEQSYNQLWNLTPTYTPTSYSMMETRPLEIQMMPPPRSSGVMRVLSVNSLDLSAPTISTTLAIPDEYSSAIKYLSLYNLLSTDSEGYDPFRAKYCYQRYQSLVEASKSLRSVVSVYSNNLPLQLDTITSLDSVSSNWQSKTGLRPWVAACAYDQIALSPAPYITTSITCDVVRTAPLPSDPASYIQIGREDIQHIIDYCKHILNLKIGGSEFSATFPLIDAFTQAATSRNQMLQQKSPNYFTHLFETPMRESNETKVN